MFSWYHRLVRDNSPLWRTRWKRWSQLDKLKWRNSTKSMEKPRLEMSLLVKLSVEWEDSQVCSMWHLNSIQLMVLITEVKISMILERMPQRLFQVDNQFQRVFYGFSLLENSQVTLKLRSSRKICSREDNLLLSKSLSSNLCQRPCTQWHNCLLVLWYANQRASSSRLINQVSIRLNIGSQHSKMLLISALRFQE